MIFDEIFYISIVYDIIILVQKINKAWEWHKYHKKYELLPLNIG